MFLSVLTVHTTNSDSYAANTTNCEIDKSFPFKNAEYQ